MPNIYGLGDGRQALYKRVKEQEPIAWASNVYYYSFYTYKAQKQNTCISVSSIGPLSEPQSFLIYWLHPRLIVENDVKLHSANVTPLTIILIKITIGT